MIRHTMDQAALSREQPALSNLSRPSNQPSLSDVLLTPALRRLLDVRQGINMSVEVFDGHFQPQLPPISGPSATRVRRLIATNGPERWRPLVEECFRTATIQAHEGQSLYAVAAPIIVGDAVVGVVLVASPREATSDASAVVTHVAEWFADLISSRLSPRAAFESAGVRQLSSLYRLLSETVPTASNRSIVYRFAEALAVWADVEIRAYVADIAGQYALAVTLPGSDTSAAPSRFESCPVPAGTTVRHLSANESRELGFGGIQDVVLATVGARSTGGHSEAEWVLAASPAATIDLDVHLPSYVDALAHALKDFYAVESSRLTWALMQHFIQFDAPEDAARAAVAEISTYIHMPVHFTVLGARGMVLFSGDHGALLGSRQSADLVSAPVAAPAGYTAVVGTRRTSERLFTDRDMRCLQTAASALAAWLPHAITTLGVGGDRRMDPRSFDQIVERQSAQAAAQQDDISLLVIAAGGRTLGSEAAHRWVVRIREHLRPTDLAGRLSSGEIGVLLPQTPFPGACVVGHRISELLTPPGVDSTTAHATINVASRSLHSLVYGPLSGSDASSRDGAREPSG